jgi:hypothetical protein
VPKGAKVYNKTGSTARVCGDMGILNVKGADGRWYPYTLVGIIEKGRSAPDYTSWIRSRGDIIRNVSSIVIRYPEHRYFHLLYWKQDGDQITLSSAVPSGRDFSPCCWRPWRC